MDYTHTKFSLLSVLLLLSIRFGRVVSCGGFMCFPQEPILQAGENIAFGVSTNAETGERDVTMVVQINYEGPASDFAWVLPVMFEPQISVGSDTMFDVLFETSRPTFNLNIQGFEGTTCEGLRERMCSFREPAPAPSLSGNATVLQEDSVGPYDYVVLEPAETEPGLSVFTWLDDNGYDQPIEAFSLIDYYARQGQLFLALRLSKGSETGDIQPLVMDYTLPAEMVNVACVPIQLTSIAATPDMPIQIYVLSEGNLQAFPVNYFTVELDDARADWLGCQNSPNCYIRDMRDRLSAFLEEEGINGHAFVTEYAGTSAIIGEDSIVMDVSLAALETAATVSEFFALLVNANVPGNDLVNSIIGRHVPNEYVEGTFLSCIDDTNVYQPSLSFCHDFLVQDSITDISALVQELNETVFAPAMEAQRFVNRFSYLTRFYGQLSPENMDKDPFFSFNSMLPDVSNVHEATAVPVCTDENIDGLEITVAGSTTTFMQPATSRCGFWSSTGDPPQFSGSDASFGALGSVSTATRLMANGYEGEEGMIVVRSAETGFFPPDVVADIVTFMDSRAPNQTVPPYNGTFLTGTEGTITATSDADNNNNDPPQDDPSSISPEEQGEEGVTLDTQSVVTAAPDESKDGVTIDTPSSLAPTPDVSETPVESDTSNAAWKAWKNTASFHYWIGLAAFFVCSTLKSF